MIYTYVDSPIGRLLLAAENGSLKHIRFSTGRKARGADPGWERRDEPFRETKRQLRAYFAGQRQGFNLSLAPDVTPFQSRVLAALQEIPYGQTCSYRDIAIAVGSPKAVRAVGGANGSNPLPIVIPCHRVIGSSGALTGFGGGLESKRFLLDLERRHSGLFSASGAA
jgi:methylated-DNA-[protein]-cysteine S-methyltransferase